MLDLFNVLDNVCKNVSYVPKVIIRYAKQHGIK